MKKIIIPILLIFAIGVNAQQSPEAKIILDKLSKETKSHIVIQSEFDISYSNLKDDTKNTSSGSITMKGDKYRLSFMDIESFYDGKTLWNYLEDVNEVNISEPEANDDDIFNPKIIFTIYENDYKYQLITSSTIEGENYSIIDLYPIDMEEEYSRIRLQINTDLYQLKSATIFGKDGSNYTITISDYKTGQKVEDSFFTFNESDYPDVEIIDMRW